MSNRNRFSSARRLALALSLVAGGGFALAGLAPAGVAMAQSRTLDVPRASGAVGERYDGYAMVRDTANAASLTSVVNTVNAERRAVYTQRAAADKVTPEQVGRIYAAEIFKAAPAGTWFLQESGQWVKK
jgi:uncharacterized protein YdbL (DUF1318 family)